MYDLRTTLKAEAGEAIGHGQSVFIAQDGLVYLCDNASGDLCHGWALTARASGGMVTIATACRMKVDLVQQIGAIVYSGELGGGTAPSTTLVALGALAGVICGIGIAADAV
ncbi:unnamed protein product, partial [marine sediment metagenome]